MIGAGGLMGIRTAVSLLVGAVLNFVIVVPIMISLGEIQPRAGVIAEGTALFGRAHILNTWALWWGITMMVVAAMVALFARPEVFVEAFRSLGRRSRAAATGNDVLKDIELPLPVSWIGIPIVGAFGVWMAHDWFGVHWVLGLASIPLILVLALIAASSTALTGITPSSSLSKIPQFTFGAIAPHSPAPNLMTAVMSAEVASNASNLLMDIKPGYMLGAKPRQQAIGHVIGIVAGALAATPLFFILFGLTGFDPAAGRSVMDTMVTDKFSFPSALQWKGVSDLVTAVFGGDGANSLLTRSIVWSMAIAGLRRAGDGGPAHPHPQPLPAVAARDRARRGGAARLLADDVRRRGAVLARGPQVRLAAGVAGLQAVGGLAGTDLRGTHRRSRAGRHR